MHWVSKTAAMESELVAGRLQAISEDEQQFWSISQPEATQPLGPQNEAAALSKLLQACPGSGKLSTERAHLLAFCDSYVSRTSLDALRQTHDPTGQPIASAATTSATEQLIDGNHLTDDVVGTPYKEGSSEDALNKWGTSKGIITCLVSASFQTASIGRSDSNSSTDNSHSHITGGVRGLMSTKALTPGHTLMSIPQSCLISYETALSSDLGAVLKRIPGLDAESAAVIWTMIDRHDTESPWSPFWASLPTAFGTGLGMSDRTLRQCLKGCNSLLSEALQARKHLAQQYQALAPVLTALVTAYPQFIKQEHLTWQRYLWAVQLWYAYAIQVQFQDGNIMPCLVPYLSLMNHSPWPHSVHFSKIDPKTGRLNVRCFRGAAAGQQVLLSYGALPNHKLLLFYGFAIPGNPYDEVTITLETRHGITHRPEILQSNREQEDMKASSGQTQTQLQHGDSAKDDQQFKQLREELLHAAGLSCTHEVRGWGALPIRLMAAARLLTASHNELKDIKTSCTMTTNKKPSGSAQKSKHKKNQKAVVAEGHTDHTIDKDAFLRHLMNKCSAACEVEALKMIQRAVSNAKQHLQVPELLKNDEHTQSEMTSKYSGNEQTVDLTEGEQEESDCVQGFAATVEMYKKGQLEVIAYVEGLISRMLSQLEAAT